MLLLYEWGAWQYAADFKGRSLIARTLLNDFFQRFGMSSLYLPALIVVVVLFCWHLVRRDPWGPQPLLHMWMWLESIVLALPLFVLGVAIFREPTAQLPVAEAVQVGASGLGWQASLVLSMGAGIFEELLFRLIAIALLHMLLVDLLSVSEYYGAIGSVLISSIAFALVHQGQLYEGGSFQLAKFLFFTAAGIYFAGVYLLRGFGIAVATHAIYDVFYDLMAAVVQQGSN
jgi:membrane protease YdiL (CAAX protease family)